MLEVETRGFKGPRFYDIIGVPRHRDNQSVFKERIHLNNWNPNILHDEITVIDHALTRPWVWTRTMFGMPTHGPNGRNPSAPNTTPGSLSELMPTTRVRRGPPLSELGEHTV